MNKFLFRKVPKSIDDISKNSDSFRFFKTSTVAESIFKVSLITKFGDDVAVVDCAVDIVALYNIWVLQFF